MDFSNISVPTNHTSMASVQLHSVPNAISTDACAKETTSMIGKQMEEVPFTSPPSTSTPCQSATRSSKWVRRAPKKYGTSSVRAMQQPKPKVYDDIQVHSIEDAIRMNMAYIKKQVMQEHVAKKDMEMKQCEELQGFDKEVAHKFVGEHEKRYSWYK